MYDTAKQARNNLASLGFKYSLDKNDRFTQPNFSGHIETNKKP